MQIGRLLRMFREGNPGPSPVLEDVVRLHEAFSRAYKFRALWFCLKGFGGVRVSRILRFGTRSPNHRDRSSSWSVLPDPRADPREANKLHFKIVKQRRRRLLWKLQRNDVGSGA